MKIATWNVNSLKVRLPHLLDWLQIANIDVLALQEIKTIDDGFPRAELEADGYRGVSNGQKHYNGDVLLAREDISEVVRDLHRIADEKERVTAVKTNGNLFNRVYSAHHKPHAQHR